VWRRRDFLQLEMQIVDPLGERAGASLSRRGGSVRRARCAIMLSVEYRGRPWTVS
jgi:hypothetical protein